MLRSLYSAVSGIDVNQKSMDVIGNNIANVNTIGFKTGRAVFQDMLSQTLTTGKTPSDARGGINPRQVGSGAYLVAVDNIFEQGVIKVTARPHDVAIEGKGFFVIRGEGTDKYYTRAGDFNFDLSGYLTTPSGYRVQGWMADPTTGVLEYTTQIKDIYLTEQHKTMPAKATTQINYAGVLDTLSTESVYEFSKMLTQATETQDILGLMDKNGFNLDLNQSDKVRVAAHASLYTSMGEIANKDGQLVGMWAGSTTVNMTVNGMNFNFHYQNTAGATGNGSFATMGDFIDELNAVFSANTTFQSTASGTVEYTQARLEEGRIYISTPPSVTFKVDSFSGNTYMNNILSSLVGTYSGSEKHSAEIFYQKDLNVSTDFKNLDELSSQIESAINGSVISGGFFKAEYLDNNFGLRDGDTVAIGYDFNGTTATATFIYRADPDPAITLGPLEFSTNKQFANVIDNYFRTTALIPVSVTPRGNGLEVQYYGNTPGDTFEFLSFNTLRPTATAMTTVSPYLEGVLNDALFAKPLSYTNNIIRLEEISGKGRLAYTLADSATQTLNPPLYSGIQTLTGFSIRKSTSGDYFNDNILIDQFGTIQAGGATSSYQFLTTATQDTILLDLFDLDGKPFSFLEDLAQIEFKALVGGQPLTDANSFTVGVKSTVNDMMEALEKYLGLGDDFNRKKNVTITNGIMTVVGEKGASNEISNLTLTSDLNFFPTFYNFGISGHQIQSASGGRFATDMTIYDQQGNEHVIKFDFAQFNTEKNEWAMRISCDDPYAKVFLNGAATNELIIRFNADGTPSHMYDRHATPMHYISNPTLRFDPGNGTNSLNDIALNIGTPGKRDGLIINRALNSLSRNDQDGHAMGILIDKLFNPAGEIVGYYTNGEIRTLGILALATFENNQGLLKVGDTMFAQTGNSGQATIGIPMSGSRGSIASSALEQSNVDLSHEFVNMIVTERGFQANSRVVTTSDEMIQELLNLKR